MSFPKAGRPRHGGLEQDLKLILPRRRALSLIASAGPAALIAACGKNQSTAVAAPPGDVASGACTPASTETNGPFPADGSNSANGSLANVLIESGIVRADIRPSFAGLTGVAEGAPVELTIAVVNANASCAPLAGHAVYIWQCDAAGRYSIYNIPAQNYLRGVAVTDTNGQATFTTIFPGCYPGRFPHIHFEVYASLAEATAYANRLLVSQFAMPEAACAEVYKNVAAYAASIRPSARLSIRTDGIFRDNTQAQIAAQTLTMSGDPLAGYTAASTVGIVV